MEFPNKADGPKPVGSKTPIPPKEKKQPVISGAVQVKRPVTRRFVGFLFSESPKSAAARIGTDVLIPQLKMGVEAACHAFIANWFWGNAVNRPTSNLVRQATFRNNVPYNVISGHVVHQNTVSNAINSRQKSTGNYEDLVVASMADAQALLASMVDYLEQYGLVAVGDLYEFANIECAPSDNAFGWTDLSAARIVPGRGGFILELPRPSLL